jgi:hypothetical protein
MPIETHNTLYALLLLTLFSSGAGIRKLKIHGKSVFAIMANTDPDIDPERVNLRTLLENFALKVFPTKKGALGYCRRYAIQVTEKQDS